MRQYHELLKTILSEGEIRTDRTGTGTKSIFGYQMRFNLKEGFPAVTTKKLAWRAVVGELLWFLEGSTDERRLAELTFGISRKDLTDKKTIWTDNADHQGVKLGYENTKFKKELGPIYGYQWRNFGGVDPIAVAKKYAGDGVDQISEILNAIKESPDSRRLILTSWNPSSINDMALPPCHMTCQFSVRKTGLSCQLYQRSCDAGLGAPFNIASYALLTHIIARECELDVSEFVYTIGDAHIYLNHIDQIKEQLLREPMRLPTLHIANSFDLGNHLYSDFPIDSANKFSLIGYDHHPAIKMEMSV